MLILLFVLHTARTVGPECGKSVLAWAHDRSARWLPSCLAFAFHCLSAMARTQHISLIIYEACAVGVARLLIGATYTVRQQFTCPAGTPTPIREGRQSRERFQSTLFPSLAHSLDRSLDRPLVRLACQAKTSGDHPFNEALITVFITKGDYQSKPTTTATATNQPNLRTISGWDQLQLEVQVRAGPGHINSSLGQANRPDCQSVATTNQPSCVPPLGIPLLPLPCTPLPWSPPSICALGA